MTALKLPVFTILFSLFGVVSSFAQQTSLAPKIAEINADIKVNKQWDYEGLTLDAQLSLRHHICLTPECNPFVSWDVYLGNLKTIQAGTHEGYAVITFDCGETECIIPTGYEKGGRYEPKKQLHFIMKDADSANRIATLLNSLKNKKE